jgi:hypothetical protein
LRLRGRESDYLTVRLIRIGGVSRQAEANDEWLIGAGAKSTSGEKRMPEILYVCLSDMHLGEEDSL